MASITVEPQTYESVLSVSSNVVEVTTTGTAEVVSVGIQGPTGPNNITTSTTTNITGILKGNGSVVSAAVAGTDYSTYSSSTFSTDFAAKDTDDLAEGSTNLYTQWIRTAVGGSNYLVPDTSTDLFAVQSLATLDDWISIGGAPTAWFGARNDEGLNYFVQEARGSSFVPLGAIFLALRVKGTGASPAAVTNSDWIGGFGFGAFGTSGYTVTSSGGWLVPGLHGRVSDSGAVGATFPFTCWIGSSTGASSAPIELLDTGVSYIRGGAGSVYSINSQDITLDKIIGAFFEGNGAAVATGTQVAVRIPYNCTVTGYSINGTPAGTTGNATVDVWVDTTANYPPTDADSITASAPCTISSDNAIYSTTLTGWDTTLNAGDWAIFNVDSATLTQITVQLFGVKR